jgi:pyruvate dehydrogenase E1 component beta subunit
MRQITYCEAIREAIFQLMEENERVILIGQGVTSPWYVGDSCRGLLEYFGSQRVIDTPVSEGAITGTAIGAALTGLQPILVHPRMDFMYLAFDQIINQAANWHYMFGMKLNVPITIRGIINRGGEQGAQHSQAIHALFSHIPGLKVVMPSTPYDAKGLLIAAVGDKNPVVYIDDRWLYNLKGDVPKEIYEIPIGKGIVRKEGRDITIVGLGYIIDEALTASEILLKDKIDCEVIDLRSAKPYDKDIVIESVKKTGKLLVLDGGWRTCGYSAEIIAEVTENAPQYLKIPPSRLTLPDTPAPASSRLEKHYYPKAEQVVESVSNLLRK